MGLIGYFKSKVIRDMSTYFLADVTNSAIAVLLLPVMTRLLTPQDYGLVATYNAYQGILSVFIGMNMSGAIAVNFFRMSREDMARYVGNVVLLLVGSVIVGIVVVLSLLALNVLDLALNPIWYVSGVIVAGFNYCIVLGLVLWQMERKPRSYGLFSVSSLLSNMVLSVTIVALILRSYNGRLIGAAIATVTFGVASLFALRRRGFLNPRIDLGHMKDALKYGVPLIPKNVSAWARTGVDRIFLVQLVGAGAVGQYAVGYQMAAVIGLIDAAFTKAWTPYALGLLKVGDDNSKRKLVKYTYLYCVLIMLAGLAFDVAARWALPLIVGPAFDKSIQYVHWILAAYVFKAMQMAGIYIFFTKKTYLNLIVVVPTSLIHVALSYTLIEAQGAIGAAQASTLSFFLTFIATWVLSAYVYPMPWLTAWRKTDRNMAPAKVSVGSSEAGTG